MIRTTSHRHTQADAIGVVPLVVLVGMSLFISYLIRRTEAFGRCAKAAPLRI